MLGRLRAEQQALSSARSSAASQAAAAAAKSPTIGRFAGAGRYGLNMAGGALLGAGLGRAAEGIGGWLGDQSFTLPTPDLSSMQVPPNFSYSP
jgi:hypothetical protein